MTVLHRMAELDHVVRKSYAAFDFQNVYTSVFTFCTVDLSAFYFDIRKDTLYCNAAGSVERRAARTVLDTLFDCLTAWLAPFHPAEGDVRLAYDLLLLSDSDTSTDADLGASKSLNARNHVGVEYDYQGLAALRAGYKAGYDSQGLGVGAGLRWHQVMFDYAFLAVSNDLGSVHRLGLTLDI